MKVLIVLFTLVASTSIAAARPSTKSTPKVMPPIIVKGTPPAPQVVYVLERSNAGAGALELKKSFVRKIVASVDQNGL